MLVAERQLDRQEAAQVLEQTREEAEQTDAHRTQLAAPQVNLNALAARVAGTRRPEYCAGRRLR